MAYLEFRKLEKAYAKVYLEALWRMLEIITKGGNVLNDLHSFNEKVVLVSGRLRRVVDVRYKSVFFGNYI